MDNELKEMLKNEMIEMFNDGYIKGATSAIEMIKTYVSNVKEIDTEDFNKVCDYYIEKIKYSK